MPDVIDGPIAEMRGLNPTQQIIEDGRIWRSRENQHPKRESTFAWDPTPYDGPLYDNPISTFKEVPQYVGFAPDYVGLRDGSEGVWRWMDLPAGAIDAARIYDIRADEIIPATDPPDPDPQILADEANARRFQRMIDESLLALTLVTDPTTNPPTTVEVIRTRRILLPPGTVRLGLPTRFHTDYGPTEDNYGGHLIFTGQYTILDYTGAAQNVHAFQLGVDRSYQENERVFGLVLEDLELQGATDADHAVFRLSQAWSNHYLRRVKVFQRGAGNGIEANNIWLARFNDVIVQRADPPPGSPRTGIGFWMRTTIDQPPVSSKYQVYVSGEFVLDRMSAFGWQTGILFGDPQRGTDPFDDQRLLSGISGQFINVEKCDEGLVVGRQAVNIDLSVVWAEQNSVCGARIYNGARNVSLRQFYVLHADASLTGFEGEIVLGKNPAEAQGEEEEAPWWNSFEGIDLDGVFQHFFVWPAVRVWALPEATGSGDEVEMGGRGAPRQRDVTIRNVPAGDPLGGPIPASALIELDDAPYETLVIENVRPSRFGDIPAGAVLLNHPERVSRLVYPSSLTRPPHESKRQLPALGDELHVSPFTNEVAAPGVDLAPGFKLDPGGPFYHRIIGTGTAELPLAADRRQGLEYHRMKVGGGNVVVKGLLDQNGHLQLINGAEHVQLTEDFAFVRLRPVKIMTGPFAGHWRWEVVAQSPTGVTFS